MEFYPSALYSKPDRQGLFKLYKFVEIILKIYLLLLFFFNFILNVLKFYSYNVLYIQKRENKYYRGISGQIARNLNSVMKCSFQLEKN